MVVGDLVKTAGPWLSFGEDTGIVVSSRVRLARNVRDTAFPAWAGEDERVRFWMRVQEAVRNLKSLSEPVCLDMGRLDAVDKDVLIERHLISGEFAQRGAGSGLVVAQEEHVAIMVNEEDHLRLQAIAPGMSLRGLWEQMDRIDSELEAYLDYAFSPEIGYLTACPTNVGTGLRASVMMHLPGLRLAGEMDAVMKGLNRIDVEVRGLLGEGTEASGDMYQLSNRTSLGDSEGQIVDRLVAVAEAVSGHEENARARLMENRPTVVLDHVGRALGVLGGAHLLTSDEAIEFLSAVKLGVELDLVEHCPVAKLNEIMLFSQAGHLQKLVKETLDADARDEVRARVVKEKLKGVTLKAGTR